MNTKYLDKIEFFKIREILSNYCKTYIGQKKALDLLPYLTEKEIEKALNQTSEAVILLFRKGQAPICEIENISVHLKCLESRFFSFSKTAFRLSTYFKNF